MVLDGLNVEAEGGVDDTCVLPIDLEHDRRLPRVVQPHHEDAHLLLLALDLSDDAKQPHLEAAREKEPPPGIDKRNRGVQGWKQNSIVIFSLHFTKFR